jgi:hypothetical protein
MNNSPSCTATPAAICCVCKCSLDIHAPHAIVNHDYAHLDCADVYDSGVTPYYSRTGRTLDAAYNRRNRSCP